MAHHSRYQTVRYDHPYDRSACQVLPHITWIRPAPSASIVQEYGKMSIHSAERRIWRGYGLQQFALLY